MQICNGFFFQNNSKKKIVQFLFLDLYQIAELILEKNDFTDSRFF